MSWKNNPHIMAAREYAQRFGFDEVIMVGIKLKNGTVETASYGRNGILCRQAWNCSDMIVETVKDFFADSGLAAPITQD